MELTLPRGENVYLRQDGRWEVRYIKERDSRGKMRYGFCYGANCKEALNKARAAQRPNDKPLAHFLDEWLEERSARVKASTLSSYRTVAKKYIRPRFGGRYPDELDAPALEDFRHTLLEKDGLSAVRVRAILLVLRSTLKYAGKDFPRLGGIVETSDVAQTKFRVLTKEEQQRLITCLQLGMDACRFGLLLALCTGLRVGELCALR